MSPDPTEPELRPKPTDRWYERCLKLMARVDWRGLALVLAALAGIGGAVWNKLDAMVDKALTARTQQGVYEVLATKLDDMSVRLAALEAAHVAKPEPPTPTVPNKPIPGSESGRAPAPKPPDAVTVTANAVPEVAYKSARLPSFQAIQRHAQDNALQLLKEDPPIAEAAPPEGTN